MTEPLKPCPFCGVIPEVEGYGKYHKGTESQEIHCNNPDCKVSPHLILFQDDYGSRDLIEEWNTRA